MVPATASRRRSTTRSIASLVVAGALISTTACGSDETADTDQIEVDTSDVESALDTAVSEVESTSDDIAQTLRDNGLDTIAGVVEQVDVSEWVGDGDFTFFAPNDEAFMSLDANATADLLTDPAQILDVLRNHTLSGTVEAGELTALDSVDTEAGETLAVSVDGDVVRVGDVTVVATDIEVAGGVVHTVDGLLIP